MRVLVTKSALTLSKERSSVIDTKTEKDLIKDTSYNTGDIIYIL